MDVIIKKVIVGFVFLFAICSLQRVKKEWEPPFQGSTESLRYQSYRRNLDRGKSPAQDGYQHTERTDCSSMSRNAYESAPYSMPMVALASFPRSGNSWTRKMLHFATQIYTGSVYEERTGSNGNTLCVKTHEHDIETIRTFDHGAILLLRNPRHSLVSEFFRVNVKEGNMTNEEAVQILKTRPQTWSNFMNWRIERWRSTNTDWILHSKRLLIIFYEELVKDPIKELTKMLQFLNQTVSRDRLFCTKKFNPWLNIKHVDFELQFPKMLDRYVEEVNDTLKLKNYRPLPTYGST